MKKINLYLVTLIFTVFASTSEAQKVSGVISMNTQETDDNDDVKYPDVSTYIAFQCDDNPQIPHFTKHNGAVINGVRITHDRGYYQPHAVELQRSMVKQTETQLKAIDDQEGTFGGNTTVRGNRGYLESHVQVFDLKFIGDTVWLMGENGDFSGRSWVLHDANNRADGLYYVLVTNSGKMFILARVSCWNNVTTKETFWIQTGKAVVVNRNPILPKQPKQPKPQPENGNGYNANTSLNFTDSSGRNITININSMGGAGGSVTIGDITAKGGSSNNNNSNTGGGAGRDGRDGKDGKDGMVVYAPPAGQQFAPQPQGGVNQERYYVTPDGVHHDKSAAYFQQLGTPNYPMKGVVNGWAEWLGGNGYAYYYNGGQQYMLGGNWNNGMFQPNYNQCYQWQPNGWQILGQVTAGFFNNATFCGGWNRNPVGASGPCWVNSYDRGWNNCPRQYNNTYYCNTNPAPQVGGPRMGWSVPANNYVQPNVVNNQGGPRSGYGFR